jgi:hypothetical protein
MNATFVLRIVCGLSLLPPVSHGQLAFAQLRVTARSISVPEGLPWSETFDHRTSQGVLRAEKGNRLLAVRIVFAEQGELRHIIADRAVVADAKGSRYAPLGFATVKVSGVTPFAAVPPGQFIIGVRAEPPQQGSTFTIDHRGDDLTFSRGGPAGTTFILVYSVPVGSRRFTLTLPTIGTVPVLGP